MLSSGVTSMVFGYSPDTVRAIAMMNGVGGVLESGMSFISFDDIELFRLTTPQVSVISQQVQRLGCLGAETFLDMVQGGHPRSRRVETIYIQRGSVESVR